MPFVIATQRTHSDRPRMFVSMNYSGWGHRTGITWVENIENARTWSEKSGAYKLVKRRVELQTLNAVVMELTPKLRATFAAPATAASTSAGTRRRTKGRQSRSRPA